METFAGTFPPISNYKGVMLCDRPAVDHRGPRPSPFNSAVVPPEQLGLNPTKKINPYAMVQKEKNKESVLYKHKEWLKMLQKVKRQEKVDEEQQDQDAAERKKRFMEYSKQLREAIRSGVPSQETQDTQEPVNNGQETYESYEKTADEGEYNNEKIDNSDDMDVPPLDLKSTVDVNKPAWAYTEDDAAEREELKEEQDMETLLDFVQDLDFENYIDDLEVRQALELMKSRVTTIKSDRSHTQQKDGTEGETRQPISLPKVKEGQQSTEEREDWNTKTGDEELKRPYTRESLMEAEHILQKSKDLQKIHSKASLGAKLEALKEEDVVNREETREKKIDVSNLPYLHRHPAV